MSSPLMKNLKIVVLMQTYPLETGLSSPILSLLPSTSEEKFYLTP